jgi:hypothetical protein
MTPYSILILICAQSVSPGDCRPETAIDVVRGPRVESAARCGRMSQATIAGVAIAPRPGQEYLKIVCRRSA